MAAVLYSVLYKVAICCGRQLEFQMRNNRMDMLSVNMCKIAKISRCSSQKFALGYTTDTSTNLSESKEAETSQVPPSAVVGPSDELLKTLNDDDQRKLKILWMEMEVSHQSGLPVPNKMRDTEWREVLVMPTRSQRLKFYRFLCIRESRRETFKQKKLARREALEMYRQDRDASEKGVNLLEYGLNKNTLFLRLYDSSMNYTYNHWQMQAIKFGQIIVVDLGYDEHMVKRECSNCAEQIADMYGANKMNREPFNFYICNAHPNSPTVQHLERHIPNLYSSSCMITVTPKSYLDLFPREKIVYLSPHSKKDLIEYDHDAIYIIGGIVDKSDQSPISLAKSKKQGLRTARLPLDQYLEWGCSASKSLTLDQMMKIMLDIKNLKDWRLALKHVPPRKLRKEGDLISTNPKLEYWRKRSLYNTK